MSFWLLALLMVLVAMALVLPSLLRRQDVKDEQNAHNIAIYRQRLGELEAEHAAGALSDASLVEAREELDRRLLGDLRPESAPRARPARRMAIAVAVLVPIISLGLYYRLGSIKPWPATQVAMPTDPQAQIAFIRDHMDELKAKVDAEPEVLQGWLMLARSHMALDEFEQAAQTLARAQARFGDEPGLLADWAEAAASDAQGDLSGLPSQLLQRSLANDPAHPKTLWLSGLAALQRDDVAQAEMFWQRLLLVLPPGSEPAGQVQEMLAQISSMQGTAPNAPPAAGPTQVQVRVSLDPALQANLPDDTTVFVLARAVEGPRAPLAVVRREAGQLPLEVQLDDSMAMLPDMRLSHFSAVVVEARVSRSGRAATESGDLFGRSGPIRAGMKGPIEIVIDQIAP